MNVQKREEVNELIVTSNEVIKILDIKRSRLSQLVKKGKIIPIKKNLFLLQDVLERKQVQKGLRKKFYRPRKSTI